MPKVEYKRMREILAEVLVERNSLDKYFDAVKYYQDGANLLDEKGYVSGKEAVISEFRWPMEDIGHWDSIYKEFKKRMKEEESKIKEDDSKPLVEVKYPPKAGCGLTHIEIGSNTWAFHQIIRGEKVRHKNWSTDDYIYYDDSRTSIFDGKNEPADFSLLADDFEGWSIYEEK